MDDKQDPKEIERVYDPYARPMRLNASHSFSASAINVGGGSGGLANGDGDEKLSILNRSG